MRFPLYLRFALILLMSLSGVIIATSYVNFKVWKDLARSYGLSTLQKKLEDSVERKNWDPADWAFVLEKSDKKGRWLNVPSGYSPQELERLAGLVLQQVRESKTKEGSFELSPKGDGAAMPQYFVIFRAESERLTILGTLDHLQLNSLSPWAIPYLSIFATVYGVAFVLASALSFYVSSSYRQLNRAIETIGAGRLEGVVLPKSSDPDLAHLSVSIGKLADLLNSRDSELAKFSQLANEDNLTKLPNFRAFQASYSAPSPELKPDQHNWLSILDLDHFKRVNDQLGHLSGDEALKKVGEILRTFNSPHTFSARYGGEEFVILMRGLTGEEASAHLIKIMNELRAARISLSPALAKQAGTTHFAVMASFGLTVLNNGRYSRKFSLEG